MLFGFLLFAFFSVTTLLQLGVYLNIWQIYYLWISIFIWFWAWNLLNFQLNSLYFGNSSILGSLRNVLMRLSVVLNCNSFQHLFNSCTLTDQYYRTLTSDSAILVPHKCPAISKQKIVIFMIWQVTIVTVQSFGNTIYLATYRPAPSPKEIYFLREGTICRQPTFFISVECL